MSKKRDKPPRFADPLDEMGIPSMTDMTGAMPALLPDEEQAELFVDVLGEQEANIPSDT